ncbi:MAG: ABC transporter ATP-binding protein [Alphaproteobacteria bacterium]|nr:ABC transporter ATP-binding protein [Alphaproteobacteria bacterium]MBO7641564.1 ABC transporter ATP-binding protein [Alphaproteobacteria bacterium]
MYPYVKPYWGRALLAVLVTVPVGSLEAVIPWAMKTYIDSITNGNVSTLTKIMPLLIIGFTLLQSSFTYLATYMNAWVGAKISNGLKFDLFKKLMRCDAEFFDQSVSGTIQMRFNNDVDAACSGLLNNLKMFSTRIFTSLSYITAMLVISWQLAIVAIIVLLIALCPLTTIRKRISDLSGKSVMAGGAITSQYIESFNGNRIISSYNLYDYQEKKFTYVLSETFKIMIKMVQRTGILSPIMHFVVGCGIALIIFTGNYLIGKGMLTAGGFAAFTASVIMLYQPIKSMGNDLNAVQLSFLAMERVFSLLRTDPKIRNKSQAKVLKKISDGIEYKDVCFEYVKDRPVLKHINLKIKLGETVAFVGNSGGGKTTLVNLLSRFYDVTGGSIEVDGKDIRDLDLDSLRDKISVVFQDNFLFNGTIRENILLGKEDATEQELQSAVKSACLDEFIGGLKKGLDTKIGERGVLLSGGQKQRVAIARAFIKNAPIVVLDEATSALDNKSEAIVQKAIDNLMEDKTVLVIAHRLSTVRNADKIAVVNYGEIVEIGTHKQLSRKKDGIYSSLYNAQLG